MQVKRQVKMQVKKTGLKAGRFGLRLVFATLNYLY